MIYIVVNRSLEMSIFRILKEIKEGITSVKANKNKQEQEEMKPEHVNIK